MILRFSLTLLCFVFFRIYSFSQEQLNSENIGDCTGAVSIEKHESFDAEFTGKAGYNADINKYNGKLQFEPFNTFWLTIRTKVNGHLTVRFLNLPEKTEITLFSTSEEDECSDIHSGKADIIRNITLVEGEQQSAFSAPINANKAYFIYINTKQEGNPQFNIETAFSDQRSLDQVKALQQVQDLRENRTEPEFTVHVVDSETNLPVEASIVVKNTKSFNALYAANVLRFPDSEYLSVDLEINAPGYFFKDQTVNRRTVESDSVVIRLRPIKTDDQIELDGLQFESESDVLVESAKAKIRRLRDFLALNKDVEIEVIGHVHKEGRNTWKAKRLSKKRANKVKAFLVDSGINGDRITTKGMGNSEMKFPKATTDKEVQANRRVEIKIK